MKSQPRIFARGVEVAALLALLGAAWWLFTWNNGFPSGWHADEPKKAHFILGGAADFHHPLLLIQAARLVFNALGGGEWAEAARAGRLVSAAAGLALAAAFYFFARPAAGRVAAWAGAAALAATPLVAVHAHYVKEDMVLAASVLLAALAWRERLRAGPGLARALALGAALGLAGSSHYKAVLLVPLVGLGLRRLGTARREWLLVAVAAAAVLAGVHGPELARLATIGTGAGQMLSDAVGGHTVDVYPVPFLFGFHLLHSLAPGLGWGLLGWAALGAAWAWRDGRARSAEDSIALLWCAVFYLAVEFLPKKPPPDFGRYVLPCAPFVLWLALRGVLRAWAERRAPLARAAIVALALGAAVAPAREALRLVASLEHDTRADLERALAQRGEGLRVWREDYASSTRQDIETMSAVDLEAARASGVTHVAVSSFRYERYLIAAAWAQQPERVRRMAEFYEALFRLPYEEFRSERPGYAFSNPTLRLVDIREGPLPAPVRASEP